jgi:hypothetical protein
MQGRRRIVGLACAALLAGGPHAALAQTPPLGFVVENGIPSATFSQPVELVFMPDGRKLVVEKAGLVWVVDTIGDKLDTPFIDLSRKVL